MGIKDGSIPSISCNYHQDIIAIKNDVCSKIFRAFPGIGIRYTC